MIDLKQLSQQRLWGLAFACQKANESLPEDQQRTIQEYANFIFGSTCDSYFSQVVEARIKEQVVPMLLGLPPEEQEAKISEFNLPNLIQDKYLQELMSL